MHDTQSAQISQKQDERNIVFMITYMLHHIYLLYYIPYIYIYIYTYIYIYVCIYIWCWRNILVYDFKFHAVAGIHYIYDLQWVETSKPPW